MSAPTKLSADAVFVAHEAELLTCDAYFKQFPGVLYFAKAQG